MLIIQNCCQYTISGLDSHRSPHPADPARPCHHPQPPLQDHPQQLPHLVAADTQRQRVRLGTLHVPGQHVAHEEPRGHIAGGR
ncbi:uncharacterized protein CDAR_48671 [Caerostris darwini]|uniref:Uncharacterized protein n=1 Tax=Caerostris darwini TaxID=1538125 RepID=A0AAV4NIT7_9ARAC|nr:uncharacterized protein CDAR_48671 [Caerostris darwini]